MAVNLGEFITLKPVVPSGFEYVAVEKKERQPAEDGESKQDPQIQTMTPPATTEPTEPKKDWGMAVAVAAGAAFVLLLS